MTEQTAYIDVVCRVQITYDRTFPTARDNVMDRFFDSQLIGGGIEGWQSGNGKYRAVILGVKQVDVTRMVQELQAACAKFADIEGLASAGGEGSPEADMEAILNVAIAAQDDLNAVLNTITSVTPDANS